MSDGVSLKQFMLFMLLPVVGLFAVYGFFLSISNNENDKKATGADAGPITLDKASTTLVTRYNENLNVSLVDSVGSSGNNTNKYIQQIPTDKNVIGSLFQIQVWDTLSGKYISWGSGVAIGGFGAILTNYHVASDLISDPARFSIFACETVSLGKTPDCKYLLSTVSAVQKSFGNQPVASNYDPDLDLALLYIDKVKVGNSWKSILDTPLNSLSFTSVNLSTYIKNIHDLNIGDPIYAIGYPDYGSGSTVRVDGTVVNFNKDMLHSYGQILVLSDFKISHGNSGGPVFDSNGKMVGIVVQCIHDLNKKCIKGLFIPLPTINWWYTNHTNANIRTWGEDRFYLNKNGISDETMGAALCLLRKNTFYNPSLSTNSCACKDGYVRESNGDCSDGKATTSQDNPISNRYGQAPDPEKEKLAIQMLDELLGNMGKPTQVTTRDTITFPIPNRPGYFILGERQGNGLWDIYFYGQTLNRKTVIKLGSTKEMFDRYIDMIKNLPQ